MRVLVTGSRDFSDEAKVNAALDEVYGQWDGKDGGDFVVVHGDARGADTLADRWAKATHEIDVRVHPEARPADWDQYGKLAGNVRNQEMVNLGADICLAFPLFGSRGTRDCMKRAKAAGIEVRDCS